MHINWPAVENVPTGQIMHEDDPSVLTRALEYVPAGQLMHKDDPFVLAYVPGEQGVHVDWPAVEYVKLECKID